MTRHDSSQNKRISILKFNKTTHVDNYKHPRHIIGT